MQEIFYPDNEDQLVDLLQAGLANGSRFSIRGQNSKAGFGYSEQADLGICMAAFNGIIEYEPAELVMRARAGTPLSDIEVALSQHNQYLAFEPPTLGKLYESNATNGSIGGAFMANLSGPRRFLAGAARDHILGIKAVSGRAEIYKSGGNVIKNVTGYDLSKLVTGSWGTLSILTELSFKVLPAPPTTISVGIDGLAADAALGLLSTVAQSALESSGLAFIPAATLAISDNEGFSPDQRNLTLIRFEGSSVSVRERVKALHQALPGAAATNLYEDEQSRTLWREIGDTGLLESTGKNSSIVKLSIAPARATNIVKLLSSFAGCYWYADAAGAWIWLSLDNANAIACIKQLRQALTDGGGSAVLYRAPDYVKQEVGIFSAMSEGLMALTRRLRKSFDPLHILNPNRLFIDP